MGARRGEALHLAMPWEVEKELLEAYRSMAKKEMNRRRDQWHKFQKEEFITGKKSHDHILFERFYVVNGELTQIQYVQHGRVAIAIDIEKK